MQNPHVKYLKTKNAFYLFYYEQGNIFCRYYSDGNWTAPQKIIEETSPHFSLCQYAEKAYLLYSNPEGKLYMASSADFSQWEHRTISEDLHRTGNTKFFLLPTDTAFHLIYHQPTESTGIDALIYTVFRDGKWEKPYQIDRFMPFPKTPFLARRLSKEHIILYYRTGRNVLSAREMLLEPYTMGSVTPLIQTPSPCTDLSIVNDSEKIHLLYIVRGMFRTQVVYQYKHTSAISTPRIIWEDTNCDNCLIYLVKDRIVLMWTGNGQPMRCIFENGIFGTVEKITEPFPSKCIKAELIGADTDSFNSIECYGDGQRFHPVQCPLFTAVSSKKTAKLAIPHDNIKKAALQDTHRQQIEELSALLAQRSDEITAVNARWKQQTEKLEKELQALKKENALLKEKQLHSETEKDV